MHGGVKNKGEEFCKISEQRVALCFDRGCTLCNGLFSLWWSVEAVKI